MAAACQASERARASQGAEVHFALGREDTVGQNSRLLLGDGTIYWVGPRDDAVLPTGPFDPDVPVLSFHGHDGRLQALVFGHATHNIGALADKRSPAIYGLAAQGLETELGAQTLFLLGAAGSTHNLGPLLLLRGDDNDAEEPGAIGTDEAVRRIQRAVKEALGRAQPLTAAPLLAAKKEIAYTIRHFDEAREDQAVSAYCRRRLDAPEPVIEVFRRMRRELAPHQGETRQTWLQALRLGDVALLAVPGELFTALGLEIKRRSPFAHTIVVELANDYIGYIPDREAFALGGYQVWTGLHSLVAEGTGETIVDEAVRLLDSLSQGGCYG